MSNNLVNRKRKKDDKFNTEYGGKGKYSNLIGTTKYKLQCIPHFLLNKCIQHPLDLECMTLNRKKVPLFQSFIASNKQRHYNASKKQQYKI